MVFKPGDIVICKETFYGQYTRGKLYEVAYPGKMSDFVYTTNDDRGNTANGISHNYIQVIDCTWLDKLLYGFG